MMARLSIRLETDGEVGADEVSDARDQYRIGRAIMPIGKQMGTRAPANQ